MSSRQLLLLVITKLCLVSIIPLSATFRNSGNDELGRKKLATINPTGFISIDCGADEDYLDEESGIFYKSDKDFITTGYNHDISPEYDVEYPYFRRQFKNLRSFPSGRKNCYTLQPRHGKNRTYMVTVFFKYGNYDAKNQTPTFDVYLGVDYWVTVRLKNSFGFVYYEIIRYFALDDSIFVCLVNTGLGVPFISSLELRLLNDSFRTTQPMLIQRFDLGSRSKTFLSRYRDDVYNRIWTNNLSSADWVSISTTSDVNIWSTNDSFGAPLEVLRTAVQPQDVLGSLSYNFTESFLLEDYYYYVNFFFVEIAKIEQGKRREFTITVNGVNYGAITPEYLKLRTLRSNITTGVQFSLNPTNRSNLPPILNAIEVMLLGPLPLSPTDPRDADAVMAIEEKYKIDREDWQGDPCLPKQVPWNGLNCSYAKDPPRIISLDLSSSGLTGNISSSFSSLKALQTLDLSYNELTGTVPEFFTHLPNLTILDLTGNKLIGPVPQSLMEKSNNGILQLSLAENPNLCLTEYSCRKKRKRNFLLPITSSVLSISLLLLLTCVVFFWKMKRTARTQSKNKEGSSVISKNRSFSYSEIIIITDNFKTVIGEGGFGKVYLGTLNDNSQVAVKLLSQNSRQGCKEFQSEAQLLLIVHHRNLVSLIGYCDDQHNKALVYEYMSYGNLREHLSETSGSILNWSERLQIAVDAAYGIEYLHNGCKPPIIHRDLKTANILLNEKLQAKIADFGLSRAFVNDSNSHITTHPAGTFGYLDPEAQASGNFNKKSDVYSFGIVLLELITGQPAVKRDVTGHIIPIQQWVTPITERGDIRSIIDPRLQGVFETNSAWKIVEIALSCIPSSAIQRPDISQVLVELKECLTIELPVGKLSNSLDIGALEMDSEMTPSPR